MTIKDVAREAGTSVSTVSKVINGHYSISRGDCGAGAPPSCGGSSGISQRQRPELRAARRRPSFSCADLRPNTASLKTRTPFEILRAWSEAPARGAKGFQLPPADTTSAWRGGGGADKNRCGAATGSESRPSLSGHEPAYAEPRR
ncbi:MAG: LacI family DNA-binding transcriptional regulator [Lachnospiraceae bacterium]